MIEPNTIAFEVVKAGLSAAVAAFTLSLTWLVGHGISAQWALRQKRKELELSTTSHFYDLYGEFLTVWRLWKVLSEGYVSDTKRITREELLERATVAEGKLEAILVKIASERELSDQEVETLGLYRQAYQQLRQSIRGNNPMIWGPDTPEYLEFKELSAHVASMLAGYAKAKPPSRGVAAENILTITGFRSKHWKSRVAARAEALQKVRLPIKQVAPTTREADRPLRGPVRTVPDPPITEVS